MTDLTGMLEIWLVSEYLQMGWKLVINKLDISVSIPLFATVF